MGKGAMVITPMSLLSLGTQIRGASVSAAASGAWPSANRGIFIPFRVPRIVTCYQIVVGFGATAGGNFDVGIFDRSGNRLVRLGATARSNSTEVVCNITDTVLNPGALYYMGMALDGTNNVIGYAPAQAGLTKALGIKEMASAYSTGLVDPITYATPSSAFFPTMALHLRGW